MDTENEVISSKIKDGIGVTGADLPGLFTEWYTFKWCEDLSASFKSGEKR